jgi:hypothetical protein
MIGDAERHFADRTVRANSAVRSSN